MPEASGPFKQLANELFNATKAILETVPHFGLLDNILTTECGPLTRADYVRKQANILLDLKQELSGIGLSRTKNFPTPGHDELQDLSALSICQAWSILLNLGHLFGTFATERCLLFILDRGPGDRESFTRTCIEAESTDRDKLRRCIDDTLDRADFYQFHYLIAYWRVATGTLSLDSATRRKSLQLIRAFLIPPSEKIARLKDVFRKSRRLTYLSLHSRIAGNKHPIPRIDHEDLCELFPKNALDQSDWLSTTRWQLLENIDLYDNEKFFGTPAAAALILGHIKAFEEWWRRNGVKDFSSKASSLFTKPQDWPIEQHQNLTPFAQIRLPTALGWMNEVRLWLHDDQAQNPWHEMQFVITPTLADRVAKVDLYQNPDAMVRVKTFRHLVAQMARAFSSHVVDRASHSLWASTASLMARLLSQRLKPGFEVRLGPVAATESHAGFACAGSYEFCRARTKRFLPASKDPQRSTELRQLLGVCDKELKWRTPCMLMFARVEIIDSTNDCVIGEVDGLAAFAGSRSVNWLLVESKERSTSSGSRQLKRLLKLAFGVQKEKLERIDIGNQTSWFGMIGSNA